MKKISILIALSICFMGCGTTGYISKYSFNLSKYVVQEKIEKIISKNTKYKVPKSMIERTMGDYFERIYIYNNEAPFELYQIGFNGDSLEWDTSKKSKLALISICQNGKFKYEADLSNTEIKRVTNWFEKEIMQKLDCEFKIIR